jgi:hypothetical protein
MHGWVQNAENGRKWGREGLDGRYAVLLCAVFLGNRRVVEVYGVSSSKMRNNNGFVREVPFFVFRSRVFLIFMLSLLSAHFRFSSVEGID